MQIPVSANGLLCCGCQRLRRSQGRRFAEGRPRLGLRLVAKRGRHLAADWQCRGGGRQRLQGRRGGAVPVRKGDEHADGVRQRRQTLRREQRRHRVGALLRERRAGGLQPQRRLQVLNGLQQTG